MYQTVPLCVGNRVPARTQASYTGAQALSMPMPAGSTAVWNPGVSVPAHHSYAGNTFRQQAPAPAPAPASAVLKVQLCPVALHETAEAGTFVIASGRRQAYVFVPRLAESGYAMPLLLVLHGRRPQQVSEEENEEYAGRYRQVADQAEAIVLMPLSADDTWDFLINEGTTRLDLDFISHALNEVRRTWIVDDARIAILGLSDGASYGLSLAVNNHDVFQAAFLWACGFVFPTPPPRLLSGSRGRPKILWWHGTQDQVFNFEKLALPLQASLVRAGYDVTFLPEEGGRHRAPEPPSLFIDTCCDFWEHMA
mmetsp:Transcript_63856/g.118712  ORF Transcript_63856/g.118712 Transcript_63856/m.118712 type:complete len:309 (-) Transcript_63856:28-954(-)